VTSTPSLRILFTALAVFLSSCAGPASTLDPAGPRAARIAQLTWLMTGIASVVFLVVVALLFLALARRSLRDTPAARRLSDTAIIVGGGILLPALVLPLIWIATLRDMAALTDPPTAPRVVIEISGHQFGYDVRYPGRGLVLRDEMRMPTDEPVLLRVTSTDVIHSFWVPRLTGKIDMVPGRTNETWIEASEPGSYLVECAEFCGLFHAKMQMRIVAEPPEAFEAWLAGGR
jgi:cytochrome c oxidase subunit 2